MKLRSTLSLLFLVIGSIILNSCDGYKFLIREHPLLPKIHTWAVGKSIDFYSPNFPIGHPAQEDTLQGFIAVQVDSKDSVYALLESFTDKQDLRRLSVSISKEIPRAKRLLPCQPIPPPPCYPSFLPKFVENVYRFYRPAFEYLPKTSSRLDPTQVQVSYLTTKDSKNFLINTNVILNYKKEEIVFVTDINRHSQPDR